MPDEIPPTVDHRREPTVPRCHSGRDGDCFWDKCPQAVDYKSYCPYAAAWEKHYEANGDDYW